MKKDMNAFKVCINVDELCKYVYTERKPVNFSSISEEVLVERQYIKQFEDKVKKELCDKIMSGELPVYITVNDSDVYEIETDDVEVIELDTENLNKVIDIYNDMMDYANETQDPIMKVHQQDFVIDYIYDKLEGKVTENEICDIMYYSVYK